MSVRCQKATSLVTVDRLETAAEEALARVCAAIYALDFHDDLLACAAECCPMSLPNRRSATRFGVKPCKEIIEGPGRKTSDEDDKHPQQDQPVGDVCGNGNCKRHAPRRARHYRRRFRPKGAVSGCVLLVTASYPCHRVDIPQFGLDDPDNFLHGPGRHVRLQRAQFFAVSLRH